MLSELQQETDHNKVTMADCWPLPYWQPGCQLVLCYLMGTEQLGPVKQVFSELKYSSVKVTDLASELAGITSSISGASSWTLCTVQGALYSVQWVVFKLQLT